MANALLAVLAGIGGWTAINGADQATPNQEQARTLAQSSLRQWGWASVQVDIAFVDLGWGAAAFSTPRGASHCSIQLDRTAWANATDEERQRRMLHETGHCVGYFGVHPESTDHWRDHSDDPASVMYPFFAPGQTIQFADRTAVFRSRLAAGWIEEPAIVAGLGLVW
jgi:hypothetical protein